MKKILIIIYLTLMLMLTLSCTPEDVYQEVQDNDSLYIENGTGIQVTEGEEYVYVSEEINATITETYSWCLESEVTTHQGYISTELVTNFEGYEGEEFCYTYATLDDGRSSHTYRNEDNSITEMTVYESDGSMQSRSIQNPSGKYVYGPGDELIYSSN